MSVATSPGATMLTRTPWPRSSRARVRAAASSAAFAIVYAAPFGGVSPTIELEMTTTSDRSHVRIPGSRSRISSSGPRVCTRSSRRYSSGPVSAIAVPRLAVPALETRRSTVPRSSPIALSIAATASVSSTAAW